MRGVYSSSLTGAGGELGRNTAGSNVGVFGRGTDPGEDDVLGEAVTGLESRHFGGCFGGWLLWKLCGV